MQERYCDDIFCMIPLSPTASRLPFSTISSLFFLYMYKLCSSSHFPYPLLLSSLPRRTAGGILRPVPPSLVPSLWNNVWSSSRSQRPSPRRKHGEDTFPNWTGNETEASSCKAFGCLGKFSPGVHWRGKSEQSAKVFSVKIVFFTNSQKFSVAEASRKDTIPCRQP